MECGVCSTISDPLHCGHWSCRVCKYDKDVSYMKCETCNKETIFTEYEKLYILYLKRKNK